MKPLLIALAVVLFGGLGYMGYNQLNKDVGFLTIKLPAPVRAGSASAPTTGKKIAFSELFKQGGSFECTVKQTVSDMESDGVVFMNGDRLRSEFSTIAEGIKVDTTIIIKDGNMYTWSSMMPKDGFKIKVEPTDGVGDNAVDSTKSVSATYSWNIEQIGDYYCEEWIMDESKFTLPTGIKFTEMKK